MAGPLDNVSGPPRVHTEVNTKAGHLRLKRRMFPVSKIADEALIVVVVTRTLDKSYRVAGATGNIEAVAVGAGRAAAVVCASARESPIVPPCEISKTSAAPAAAGTKAIPKRDDHLYSMDPILQ